MRKSVALLLAVIFVISFAGCSKKKEETPAPTSSVENRSNEIAEAVAKGGIPEADYKLGEAVSTLSERYVEILNEQYQQSGDGGHVHGDGDVYYDRYEDEDRGTLCYAFDNKFIYYYQKDKSEQGVSAIVSYDDAFGFKQGSSRKDVEDRLSSLNTEKLNAGDDELYFLRSGYGNYIILRYRSGKYQLDFYFFENALVATVLRDTENWTI